MRNAKIEIPFISSEGGDFGNRSFLVFDRIPFYKSSGQNSNLPNTWFPFIGISSRNNPYLSRDESDGLQSIFFNMGKSSWIIKPDFYFTTERLSTLVKDANIADLQVKAREGMGELELLRAEVLREFKEKGNQLDESMDAAMRDICDRLYNCKIAALSAAIAKHTVDDNSFWATPIGNLFSQKLEARYSAYFLPDLSLVCVGTANQDSESINTFVKEHHGYIYNGHISEYIGRLESFNMLRAATAVAEYTSGDRLQQDGGSSEIPKKNDALIYTSAAGPIKHLYIIGHDINHDEIFAMAESNDVPCAFIFLSKLNPDENPLDAYRETLKKIVSEKELSPHVQITISAHGNVGRSQTLSGTAHFIGAALEQNIITAELLDVTETTLYLNAENSTTHIYSCHGGRVVQDLIAYKPDLQIGVVTHTTDDLVSFGVFDDEGMRNGLQRHNDTGITGAIRTLYDFVADSIAGNDVATSYYVSDGTGRVHGTVRPHQHFLSHPKDYLLLAINNAFAGIPEDDREFLLQQLNIQKMFDDAPSDWVEHYRTAGLLVAAAHGDTEHINTYADAGYDIQATLNKTSALDLAISSNKPNSVRCLLEKGFDPNTNNRTKTPLSEALLQHRFEIVGILLSDPRIDLNCANKDGGTALHLFSVQDDQIDSVRLLLNDSRTDPNLKNKSGETALQIAVRNGQIEIARTLLSDARINPAVLNSSGETLVQIAMRTSNSAMVDLLLTHGVEPLSCKALVRFITAGTGLTHSNTSAQEILKYIHEKEININNDAIIFSKASLIAMRPETDASLAEMKAFLDAGLNPNIVDKRGQSYLHHAARTGNAKMVDLLLNHGANPNIYDVDGYKPLHCAAEEGHVEITTILLADKRVDANAKTKMGRNAIDLVTSNLTRDSASNENKFGVTFNLLISDGRAEYSDSAKRGVEMRKHMEQSSTRTSSSPFLFRMPNDGAPGQKSTADQTPKKHI